MNSKTIVVDLDDTLCFTYNRDFLNATPNKPLIEKLNKLFENGWDIQIVTARGQISCKGNYANADKKYRVQTENWLLAHNVKYTSLSFRKKLARYYIDDKGILPDDFLKLEFDYVGKSGADITMDSNFVYKNYPTFESAQEFINWQKYLQMQCARNNGLKQINSPKIVSLIGNEIKMQRVFHNGHCTESIKKSIEIIECMSKSPSQFSQHPYIYIENIFHHLSLLNGRETFHFHSAIKNFVDGNIKIIIDGLDGANTFSHGDFSIENILVDGVNDKLYLIDPIYQQNKFQSYLLDKAKLYWSLILSQKSDLIFAFLLECPNNSLLNALTICEGIRTLKYCTPVEKSRRMEIIEGLCEQESK